MKWIVKNSETGSIVAGFMLFADASDAYTVEAFDLYYKVK